MPPEERGQVPPKAAEFPYLEVVNKDKKVKQLDEKLLLSTHEIGAYQPVIRKHGNLNWQCYDLNKAFDWTIGLDSNNALVLVPIRKSEL